MECALESRWVWQYDKVQECVSRVCLCSRNLIRPSYWNCRSGVFVQPFHSPLAAGQWNILPSVKFPHHDGITEMCQEALCLGRLTHSCTERQPHIKISSHTHTCTKARTHKATTWKVQPDPENLKVSEAQTNTLTLTCCCFFSQTKGQLPPGHVLPVFFELWVFTSNTVCTIVYIHLSLKDIVAVIYFAKYFVSCTFQVI